MAGGFKIAEAYVEIKADNTGLRAEVDKDVKEAGVGQDIKVGLKVDKASLGGFFSNIAPFILPAVAAVGQLTGALGLVPAMGLAAGVTFATLKIGVSGFSDAVKKGGADLAALPPNAREAATAIRDLGPAWSSLHLDVQSRLFQGVSADVRRLGVADLPVLRSGLDQTASALNQGVHYFTAWATSSKTVGDLKTIFDNTGISTQNLMRSLQPILGIIRDIATVGSQFLPKLTSGFADAAQRAADFISHARDTGKLAGWIQTGITSFGQLWQVIKNVVGIIMQMAATGPSILPMLTSVTGLVLRLVTEFPQLLPLVAGLVAGWKAWTIAQIALNVAMDANPIGLVVIALAALVAAAILAWNHSQVLRDTLTSAWQQISAVVLPAIQQIWGMIQNQLIPSFLNLVNAAAPVIAFFVGVLAPTVVNVFNTIVGVIQGAISVITGIFQVFAGVLTGNWTTVWNGIRNIVSGVLQAVWSIISGALNNILSLFGTSLGQIESTVSSGFQRVVSAASSAINSLITVVGSIPGRILGALGNLGSLLYNAGASVIQGLISGIQSRVSAVASAIGNIAATIRGALPFSPAKWGPLSGSGSPDIAGSIISQMLAQGMVSSIGTVAAATRQVAGAVFSNLPDIVKYGTVSQEVWNQLMAAGWTGRAGDGMEALYRPAASGVGSGPVVYGSVSQSAWDQLRAAGWTGRPGDGMEALYAPSSGGGSSPVISGSVSDAVWQSLLAAGWKGDPNDHMEALYAPSSGGGSNPVISGSVTVGASDSHLGSRTGRTFGPVTVNVTQTSGSPAETGRFVALALRMVG